MSCSVIRPLFQLDLQVVNLFLHVAEVIRPALIAKLSQSGFGGIPGFFVDLRGGEFQKAGWLERPDLRHAFPVRDGLRPSVLLFEPRPALRGSPIRWGASRRSMCKPVQ